MQPQPSSGMKEVGTGRQPACALESSPPVPGLPSPTTAGRVCPAGAPTTAGSCASRGPTTAGSCAEPGQTLPWVGRSLPVSDLGR